MNQCGVSTEIRRLKTTGLPAAPQGPQVYLKPCRGMMIFNRIENYAEQTSVNYKAVFRSYVLISSIQQLCAQANAPCYTTCVCRVCAIHLLTATGIGNRNCIDQTRDSTCMCMRHGNGTQSAARSDREEWQECDECDKTSQGRQTLFCCRRFVLFFHV